MSVDLLSRVYDGNWHVGRRPSLSSRLLPAHLCRSHPVWSMTVFECMMDIALFPALERNLVDRSDEEREYRAGIRNLQRTLGGAQECQRTLLLIYVLLRARANS